MASYLSRRLSIAGLVLVAGGLPAATWPAGAPATADAADPVLIEIEAEPETPYVQARVRYRVRILARVPLRQATLSEPGAADASIDRLGSERRWSEERGGVRYQVLERVYAIVPGRVGALRIEGPRLAVAVPQGTPDAPGQAAGSGLIPRLTTLHRDAAPLVLEVRPPPAAAETPWVPAESLSISETWPPVAEGRVGVPLTRTVRIEAVGIAAAQLPEPPIPAVPGMKVYPGRSERAQQASGEDLLASLVREDSFVPTVAGRLRIPGLRLPWWSLGMDEPRQAVLAARDWRVFGEVAVEAGEAARGRLAAAVSADLWQGPWLSVLLGLGWLATLGLWWRQRRRAGRLEVADARVPADELPGGIAPARQRLERACRASDAASARAALMDWGRARWPGDPPRGPEQVYARLGADARSRAQALALEAALYSAQPPGWDGPAAARVMLPWLLSDTGNRDNPLYRLPPLYPPEG